MNREELYAKAEEAADLANEAPDDVERQRLLAAVEFWRKRIEAIAPRPAS